MASFWRVTRDGDGLPMVMKIPLLRPGEDPLTIIGYEVEQMILPRLAGSHTPRFIATGDFERPFIVMEFIAGASVKSLLASVPLVPNEVAAIGAKDRLCPARHPSPTCHPSRSQAEQCDPAWGK